MAELSERVDVVARFVVQQIEAAVRSKRRPQLCDDLVCRSVVDGPQRDVRAPRFDLLCVVKRHQDREVTDDQRAESDLVAETLHVLPR